MGYSFQTGCEPAATSTAGRPGSVEARARGRRWLVSGQRRTLSEAGPGESLESIAFLLGGLRKSRSAEVTSRRHANIRIKRLRLNSNPPATRQATGDGLF